MAKKSKLPVEKLGASKPVPVRIIQDSPNTKPDRDCEARERQYRAEDALRDLERAEKHKRDKALMGDVKKLAREKADSLKKIC